MKTRILLLLAASSAALFAGPRASTNYQIAADSADAGGRRATSANYAHDGSAGDVAGLSTLAAPATAAKHGYVGQLTERTGLALTGAAATVNEGGTLQLGAWQTLDDASLLAVPSSSVTWSVPSGPLVAIDAGGLARAGLVYQDAAAIAQADYLGDSAAFALTVLNVTDDDFGAYAGDGIADAWQVQYFGEDNPAAVANADPDGDGQSNLFEFTAGLVPTDPQSVFQLRLAPVAGLPAQMKLVFSPRLDGRSYEIQFRNSLTAGAWQPLLGATVDDDGLDRTVTDPSATGAARFYRVEITKP